MKMKPGVKRRSFLAAVLVGITGLSAHAVYSRRSADVPEIVTQTVTRGPIVNVVSASGTLEADTTVQVGSQISGTVQALYADFNSIVRKGQVIARLDPSLLQAEVDQARASLVRAEADVERLTVAVNDAMIKERRARELAERELIPRSDLEAAEVARSTAEAQVRSARAQVTQARAALSQAEVNRQKTVIVSPIDGIVTARNFDVGQTVAASLQAPTLFVIAADLGQMQVKASVDESDLGQVHEGQAVTFTVDAYPQDTFTGTIRQIRLNPIVEQNVVTYAAMISAPNPKLKLRPGMTAAITVEVARRENVLRVPTAALRFRPGEDLLAVFDRSPGDVSESEAAVKTGGSANQASRNNVSTVWLFDGSLHPIAVSIGASDGTFSELLDETLPEGSKVAIRVASADTRSGSSSSSGNPLIGQPPRRF